MDNLILLTDKSRLSEIYRLRVKAWQQHGQITIEKYPAGYHDGLDEKGYHWIIVRDSQIIGAARLNILSTLEELPYPETFKRVINCDGFPFIFYSRLVIDPDCQGSNLSCLLDKARINFIKEHQEFKKVVATAGVRRAKTLEQYGFEIIDRVNENDDYKSMDNFETYIIELKNE